MIMIIVVTLGIATIVAIALTNLFVHFFSLLPMSISLMLLVDHISFQSLHRTVTETLSTVYEIGPSSERHCEVEQSLELVIGKAIVLVGTRELSDQKIDLFQSV